MWEFQVFWRAVHSFINAGYSFKHRRQISLFTFCELIKCLVWRLHWESSQKGKKRPKNTTNWLNGCKRKKYCKGRLNAVYAGIKWSWRCGEIVWTDLNGRCFFLFFFKDITNKNYSKWIDSYAVCISATCSSTYCFFFNFVMIVHVICIVLGVVIVLNLPKVPASCSKAVL